MLLRRWSSAWIGIRGIGSASTFFRDGLCDFDVLGSDVGKLFWIVDELESLKTPYLMSASILIAG